MAVAATVPAAPALLGQDSQAAEVAAPDDARRLTVDRQLDMERASDPRISPDGSRILYTRSHVNRMEDRWDSEIWIMEADGSRQRFLIDG